MALRVWLAACVALTAVALVWLLGGGPAPGPGAPPPVPDSAIPPNATAKAVAPARAVKKNGDAADMDVDVDVSSLPGVLWMAPFLSGGGYSSEAISFVTSLAAMRDRTVAAAAAAAAEGASPASARAPPATVWPLAIAQHGDGFNARFVNGLQQTATFARLQQLSTAVAQLNPYRSVTVCHSEPGAWYPPLYSTSFCPPVRYGKSFVVGRTMFETDRLPDGWPARLALMNEVWVPTEFARAIFVRAGVNPTAVRVIPEPVDVDTFRPRDDDGDDVASTPFPFPLRPPRPADAPVGPDAGREQPQQQPGQPAPAPPPTPPLREPPAYLELQPAATAYRFLSVFKWEERKGWPILLRAFFEEFGRPLAPASQEALAAAHAAQERAYDAARARYQCRLATLRTAADDSATADASSSSAAASSACDELPLPPSGASRVEAGASRFALPATDVAGGSSDVVLYILTNAYHTGDDFDWTIAQFVADSAASLHGLALPPVRLLQSDLPQQLLPNLYRSVHAFVLPSRGEGWGRPHVEAMSSGLPVIATHWSGPSQYMTEHNSYPLRHDGMDTITSGAFAGHQWARPSVTHLRELLRRVASPEHRSEARAKGRAARHDMVTRYCPDCVARVVLRALKHITRDYPQYFK